MAGGPLWTDQRVKRLMLEAEFKTLDQLAADFNVNRKTLANRMATLGIRQRDGLLSLRECVRRTGYLKHQLYRARDALDQRWKPTGHKKGGRLGISEDQLAALCDYLRTET